MRWSRYKYLNDVYVITDGVSNIGQLRLRTVIIIIGMLSLADNKPTLLVRCCGNCVHIRRPICHAVYQGKTTYHRFFLQNQVLGDIVECT